jgi:hypothetical protein
MCYEYMGMQKGCNLHFGQIRDRTDLFIFKTGIRGCLSRLRQTRHATRQMPERPLARSLLRQSGYLTSAIQAEYSQRLSMPDVPDGFFIDWDGNTRNTRDAGGGYVIEADPVAKYVAIMQGSSLVHEATFYKTMEDIKKAGIKTQLVPGSHPWGRPDDGF